MKFSAPTTLRLSQIRIEAPNWKDFVSAAVQDVCEGLGVDFSKTKPQHKLRGLSLVGTQSQSW